MFPLALPNFGGEVSPDGERVVISAPAKINLFLRVLGKRPDGYHDIHSWFQALDLADHLEIERVSGAAIEIITDAPGVPTGPENLIYQAAEAIRTRYAPRVGFRVRLDKRIPVGAGLGGGSSDAAAFIKGANKLLNLGLMGRQMEEIGLQLGSDVPFFFSRGQAEVTGRGEMVRPISLPLDYRVALVTPPFQIRAAEAYLRFRLDLTSPFTGINLVNCGQARELFFVISGEVNDLERALRESHPVLVRIRKELEKSGADIVRLSGSGPTVFALYGDRIKAEEKLRATCEGEGWGCVTTDPIILPA